MSKHQYDTEFSLFDQYDENIVAEFEVTVNYTYAPGSPEEGPSYASGGQPADPPEIDFGPKDLVVIFVSKEKMEDGRRHIRTKVELPPFLLQLIYDKIDADYRQIMIEHAEEEGE